jgi:uncharacterized protein (DUF58 family)
LTRLGYGSLPFGAGLLALGLLAHWQPIGVLGAGILALAAGSFMYVMWRPRIHLERAIEPARVEKGEPAIALIHVTNLSRRSLPPVLIEQRLGDRPVRGRLPRLGRRATGVRTYRLPTSRRGTFEIGPVELTRADPFGLGRTVQRLGAPQRIAVHPRLLRLRPLPTGASRNLEGPSSDNSPQGTVTFHRLREYAVGDDLRIIHWPSTARLGQLVVRHNVDTAQPYTVVLLDLDPAGYSAGSFEEAIDAAASVVVSTGASRAPVQLRTSAGQRMGGPANRDPSALIDFLTDVQPAASGRLDAELNLLRHDRGGTALVVVTGRLDVGGLPGVAALRRRFDRVVVISLDTRAGGEHGHPGLVVIQASSADEVARRWNTVAVR